MAQNTELKLSKLEGNTSSFIEKSSKEIQNTSFQNSNQSFQSHSIPEKEENQKQNQQNLLRNGKNKGEEEDDENNGKLILWKKIQLKKNITTSQFVASMAHYLLMPFIFVSVEILQPTLFKDNFNIKPEDAGTQNSMIILIDVLVRLIFAPVAGVLTDKLGRKIVLFYGMVVVTTSITIIPFCSNLYPSYALVRCLYAHGAICLAVQPLLGDYIADQTKGRAASLSVIMASAGAMLAAAIVAQVQKAGLTICYASMAGGYLVFGLVYWFFLKGGNKYYLSKDNANEQKQEKSCGSLVKVGIQAAQNPWILMGYITNLMARIDSILLSMYLIIWTYDQTDKSSYSDSEDEGHRLAGIAYTSTFLFTIVYGLLMERISKFWTLLAMFVLTAVGGFMMLVADSPSNPLTFNIMAILGAGISGLQTAAQFLIQKYAQNSHRGYITGLSNIFSVFGVLTCVSSGFLIDSVSDVAPFVWTGILSLFSLSILCYCYIRHSKKYKKWSQEVENIQKIQDLKLNNSQKEDLLYMENPLILQYSPHEK